MPILPIAEISVILSLYVHKYVYLLQMIDLRSLQVFDIVRDVFVGIITNWVEAALVTVFGILLAGILKLKPDLREQVKTFGGRALAFVWGRRALILFTILLVILSSSLLSAPVHSKTLQSVEERRVNGIKGQLRCGINITAPGLGSLTKEASSLSTIPMDEINAGNVNTHALEPEQVKGLDIDFCRAVAVAIFGADEVSKHWKPIYFSDSERLAAVRDGRVDVAFRNTSWTHERDFEDGVDFGPPNLYDQLVILINNSEGNINSEGSDKELLEQREICVAEGTTSHSNMLIFKEEKSSKDSIEFTLRTQRKSNSDEIDDTSKAFDAFFSGECDAIASDRSQIVPKIYDRSDFKDYLIYGDNDNEFIATELLSPILPEADSVWKALISQVLYTTIRAEELGISSKDVVQKFRSIDSNFGDPVVKKFLKPDESDNYWAKLHVSNDYPAHDIIAEVGNYGEIYRNNLGDIYEKYLKSIQPLQRPEDVEKLIADVRGPNKLLREDGVLAVPPL